MSMEIIARLHIFLRFSIGNYAIILIFLTRSFFMIKGNRVWDRIYDII